MKKPAIFPKVCTAVSLVASLLAATGCGSQSVPRDLMLEEASKQSVERPVAMRGEGSFLDGKVTALATVTRGFDRGVRGGPGGRAGGNRPGEGLYDDRRNRRDDVGAFTEVYNIGGYGDSEEEQKEAMQDYIRQARARRAAGSPMPPVTLRVLFENKGTEPIELEVTEVNSDLGNFSVRPPKLTNPPGEKAVLDPMISQLGVTSDEIPLKLAVRAGGKKEQQVVIVKNILAESLRKEFEKAQK
ncbi:MAG: hypothetical protein ACREF9_13330 [Opitutaceae bacterium]